MRRRIVMAVVLTLLTGCGLLLSPDRTTIDPAAILRPLLLPSTIQVQVTDQPPPLLPGAPLSRAQQHWVGIDQTTRERLGMVEVAIYPTDQAATAAYTAFIRTQGGAADFSRLGERASVSGIPRTLNLVFQRCGSLVVIMTQQMDSEALLVYANNLDIHLHAALCPF